jgi:cyclopropane fatty-acyl-phospholipid synthase-like methyltransferase
VTAEPTPPWSLYWEELGHQHSFTVEAQDYVERLREALPLRPADRVLEFGCGFGHVVELLAPAVAAVGYWDGARAMRESTASRVARFRTAFPVDLSRPRPLDAFGVFDAVLANGVVQHLDRDELARWLTRWVSLLAPTGWIVVSDVPAPQTSAVREALGQVRFAVRHRFLVRAVYEALGEARRYARSRGENSPTRWTPEEIAEVAGAAGLTATPLPTNLTHRSGRFTVVLHRTGDGERDPLPAP